MADAKPTKPALTDAAADGEESEAPESKLRWVLGWVVVPCLVLGGIYGTGVHLGANYPESWFTRFVLWVVGLFA